MKNLGLNILLKKIYEKAKRFFQISPFKHYCLALGIFRILFNIRWSGRGRKENCKVPKNSSSSSLYWLKNFGETPGLLLLTGEAYYGIILLKLKIIFNKEGVLCLLARDG